MPHDAHLFGLPRKKVSFVDINAETTQSFFTPDHPTLHHPAQLLSLVAVFSFFSFISLTLSHNRATMMADHALRFEPPAVAFVDTTKGFGFLNPAHLRKSIKRTKVSSDDSPSLIQRTRTPTGVNSNHGNNNMDTEIPSSPARFGTTLLRRALSTTTRRSNSGNDTSTSTTIAVAANRARDRYQRKQKHRSSMVDGGVMHDTTAIKESSIPARPQSTLLMSSNQQRQQVALAQVSMEEDEVLRRTAAVVIDRHVGQYMRVGDLVSLFGSKRSGSLWDKVKLHFRNSNNFGRSLSNEHPHHHRRVFGQPLDNMDWGMANNDDGGNDTTAEQTTRGDAIGYMMTHHPIMAACFSKSAAIPPIMQNCILALLQQGTQPLFFPTHKNMY